MWTPKDLDDLTPVALLPMAFLLGWLCSLLASFVRDSLFLHSPTFKDLLTCPDSLRQLQTLISHILVYDQLVPRWDDMTGEHSRKELLSVALLADKKKRWRKVQGRGREIYLFNPYPQWSISLYQASPPCILFNYKSAPLVQWIPKSFTHVPECMRLVGGI